MIVAPEAKRDLVLCDEPELGHLGGGKWRQRDLVGKKMRKLVVRAKEGQ